MTEAALIKDGERVDDLQLSGLRIIQDPARFCFGMDAVLLSGFVRCGQGARLLDIGTGTGILPLLLSAKTGAARLTGIEIQPDSADMARRSVCLNRLEERISIVTGDIREAGGGFAPASFDVITCNPPYIKAAGGLRNASAAKTLARHEVCCTLEDVAIAAARLLVAGGRFFMVHRPERLPEAVCTLEARGLAIKRLRLVYPYIHRAPSLFLVEAVRGGRPGMTAEPPLIIYRREGEYSEELRRDFGY